MSAAHALAGDVIMVREPIPVQDSIGVGDELTPGYYAIVGQLGERLILARAGEDEEGDAIACGEPFTISAQWLETEALGITYLKAKRWMRIDTESP